MEDAQNMLEEVYRVAPVPEEYMKYQLHVSTGMEMPQIELWFQNRLSSEGSSQLPMGGNPDWSSMQRPTIQITSGAERLPSNSGQRRPGRPDLAQPPGMLQAGARAKLGDGLLARRSSQGALLATEHRGKVAEQPERPRDHSNSSAALQAFPFPELHSEAEAGRSLQEGQLAGLPSLDWLSENSNSDGGRGPETLDAGAARQPSGALIEATIGDPAELLSQPNAPFQLNFLSSSRDERPSKESAPGAPDNDGFKVPAAPGEHQALRQQRSSGSDQLQLRSADRAPTTPKGMRQPQSPRRSHSHQQQLQQRLPSADGQHQRQWRSHMDASAPMMDCPDVLPKTSEPEWHGQMLTTLGGSVPVTASRQWRANWGAMGAQQGYLSEQDMVYSVSMTSSMDSSRDAFSMRHSEASQQLEELERGHILERGTVSLPAMRNFCQELLKKPPQHGIECHGKANRNECAVQLEELERGQILERGTVSLPAMRDFRQELLKGASWHASEAPPAPAGDLTGWRRSGRTPSSDPPPAFIPSPNRVPNQEPAPPQPDSSLHNRSSDPTPLPEAAAQGDTAPAQRRSSGLPRSISDISETHSLQAYASLRDHGSATDPNLLPVDTAQADAEPEAGSDARFVEEDLESVVTLIGLQTITSVQEYDGSKQLFLFEQLTRLDSLDTDFGGASSSKRRRVRHQHFWRNSDKLPPDHRLYVASADIKLALEELEPVRGRRQITSAERTNMWSVCLTSKGVLNYLNRRISPVGVRLFRASQRAAKGGSAGGPAPEKALLPPMLAPRPKPLPSPAAAVATIAEEDEGLPGITRKRRSSSRLRRETSGKGSP